MSGHLLDCSEDGAPFGECPISTSEGDRGDPFVRLPDLAKTLHQL